MKRRLPWVAEWITDLVVSGRILRLRGFAWAIELLLIPYTIIATQPRSRRFLLLSYVSVTEQGYERLEEQSSTQHRICCDANGAPGLSGV